MVDNQELVLRRVRRLSGFAISLALMFSVLYTAIGTLRAFRAIAVSKTVDPHQLSHSISKSLSIGTIALPIAAIALLVWLWATYRISRTTARAKIDSRRDVGNSFKE